MRDHISFSSPFFVLSAKIPTFKCINTKYIIAFDLYVWKTLHQTLEVAHMYIESDKIFTVQVLNLTYQQVKRI